MAAGNFYRHNYEDVTPRRAAYGKLWGSICRRCGRRLKKSWRGKLATKLRRMESEFSLACTGDIYAGSVIGAGAALPRIMSDPFSAITMVAE